MSPAHPYVGIADHQRWSRGVTWVPPGDLDPVTHPRFTLRPEERIATMGSCFAQHLSRHLVQLGFNYFVAEGAPAGVSDATAAARQFGTFSARYGNVYTVAQAEQLVARAFGELTPRDEAWVRPDGRWVDPLRPGVEPDGFDSVEAVAADRERHLAAVREVVERSDVLVFTLGLTEAWRSRRDGTVFPSAPGVVAGRYDERDHEFVNFGVGEVTDGLVRLCERLRGLNTGLRVLLTVSPVPLIATYEPRHVLVSTGYSKSVLRVAAQAAVEALEFVDYFPSYELIVSATSPRNYYADDLRDVTATGVAHVMRCFSRHYVAPTERDATPSLVAAMPAEIVCDEVTIDAAIEASR